MKRRVLFAFLLPGFVLSFSSCKKLNEPTELGDELLPAVDNVNTFEANFDVSAGYYPFADSTKASPLDKLALGQINDPSFGSTKADMYFNLSSTVYRSSGSSPFYNKSTISIDSVVLSLGYASVYGDSNATVNVEVSEIAADDNFNDTVLYRYDHPSSFATTGPVLGTKAFTTASLKDSIKIARNNDTSKVANVLRIRLDNSLGAKLSQFDTANGGALSNDTLFRAAFRGLAVKTTNATGAGALGYFDLNSTGSALYVYYKSKKGDGTDSLSTATFLHSSYSATTASKDNYGVANSVVRTPAGEYLADLGKANPQQLYLQSSPSGSYVNIRVPALDTFPNKVIHRAELIAYKAPTLQENYFGVPNQLLLDHKGITDTAFIFDEDIPIDYSTGSVSLSAFGGTLRNNGYRFNLTRYVQGIVTRKNPNDTMRLYAPLRSVLYAKTGRVYISVPALSYIAYGRVALAGGSNPDPALRMRLRVVYSNL